MKIWLIYSLQVLDVVVCALVAYFLPSDYPDGFATCMLSGVAILCILEQLKRIEEDRSVKHNIEIKDCISFKEVLEAEGIDTSDNEKVKLLQTFYQEGYMKGANDKNPNYEYSVKYREIVTRLLTLFNKTINPIGLEQLEKCLDEMDKYQKENMMM